MRRIKITDARDGLATLINRVAFGRERVVLVRRGKPLAAVVSVDDAELLEALEDERDLAEVRAALADPENAERIGWEQVKANLGL